MVNVRFEAFDELLRESNFIIKDFQGMVIMQRLGFVIHGEIGDKVSLVLLGLLVLVIYFVVQNGCVD